MNWRFFVQPFRQHPRRWKLAVSLRPSLGRRSALDFDWAFRSTSFAIRRKSVPPMALRRRPMRRVADQKADTERDCRRGVRVFFHEPPKEIMACNGGVLDCLGAFGSRLLGPAIGVLHSACSLVQVPFDLAPGVARGSAQTFLYLAPNRSDGAFDPVISHRRSPHRNWMCFVNKGYGAKFQ